MSWWQSPKSEDVCKIYGGRAFGQTIIVTGASSGLGLETTRRLLLCGSRVVAVVRDCEKMRRVAMDLWMESMGNDPVNSGECSSKDDEASNEKRVLMSDTKWGNQLVIITCDLSELVSVRACAEAIITAKLSVHGIVCNAGVYGIPTHSLTSEGIEMHMAANHYGHFLFVHLLLPLLRACSPARVVFVSSALHGYTSLTKSIPSQDPEGKSFAKQVFGENNCKDSSSKSASAQLHSSYSSSEAYAASKLANICTASELARRVPNAGVLFMSIHPGMCRTDIARNSSPFMLALFKTVAYPILRSPSQGAASIMHCLLAPSSLLVQGGYYGNCILDRPSSLACDAGFAKWIYDTAINLTSSPSVDIVSSE